MQELIDLIKYLGPKVDKIVQNDPEFIALTNKIPDRNDRIIIKLGIELDDGYYAHKDIIVKDDRIVKVIKGNMQDPNMQKEQKNANRS